MRTHLPIDREMLLATLTYDPETGILRWKHGGRGKMAGAIAGCVAKNGYRYVRIGGRKGGRHLLAQRVIWVMVTGQQPNGDVDHENGRRDANRFVNLREASRSENLAHRTKLMKNNTSGFSGVYFNSQSGKWRAEVKFKGKKLHIGSFNSPKEAAEARKAKCADLLGPFASIV